MAQEQQQQTTTEQPVHQSAQQHNSAPPFGNHYGQNTGYGHPYGYANPGDDISIMQGKLTAILRCDMSAMGRLMELIARRGQMSYGALNGLHTMSPADRANVKAEITRIEVEIAQLLAL